MSYDVTLRHASGETCKVPRFEGGGTYALGGSDDAELNITYNYGECYALVRTWGGLVFGIRFLDKKRAGNVIQLLEHVVKFLGERKYERDYWAPTPGNAGHAAAILLAWARLHPDAIFEVS